MKKIDNFVNCLNVLKKADFDNANVDEIYRTGIIGQFNLTFELAWKALQEVLRLHDVEGAESGSPREILQLANKVNFLDSDAVWLSMLKTRNLSVHLYNEEEAVEMIGKIKDEYIEAFEKLVKVLNDKLEN